MTTTVTMPQLGESVVEGTIAKWLVREGEVVQEDQALVEVTTDKIDTEIPSPAAGVIGKIHVREGETVKIGTVLCDIAPAGAGAGAGVGAPREASREAPREAPRTTPRKPAEAGMADAAAPAPRARAVSAATAPPSAATAPPPPAAAPRSPSVAPSPAGEKPRPTAATTRSALAQPGVALDESRVAAARSKRRESREQGDGDGAPPAAAGRRITPLVRKMAAEYDVDLSRITGTGVGGRVTKDDVLEHLKLSSMAETALVEDADYASVLGRETPRTERSARAPQPAATSLKDVARPAAGRATPSARPGLASFELREYAPPDIRPGEGDRVEPFSKRRRIIAEHMVYSKAVSPHVYTLAEIDMGGVVALREANKRAFKESEGVTLTFLHFVIVAAARALRDFPSVNAVVGRDELILRRDVNIGVAVETEQGLVVPVVRNADRLSLRGVAREVEELARKARERKLRLEDLQGGTFTISNPGREGNLVGFAVINQPQLGILRMGEIKKRPVVIEVDGADAIAIRPIMLMSLSYDHRVIDGVTGNSFLYRVKEYLERAEFEI